MLSWGNPGGGAVAYKGEVSDSSIFSGTVYQIPEQTGLSFNTASLGLTPKHYYYHLMAKDAAGNWTATFGTSGEFGLAPAAPLLSSPGNNAGLSSGTVGLSWGAVGGADHYQVQVDNTPWSSPEYQNLNVLTNSDSANLTSAPDGTYSWWVRSVSSAGDIGPWSATFKFTVNRKPPAPGLSTPGNKTLTNDNTPEFVWYEAGSGENLATSYSVTIKLGRTVSQVLNATNANCTGGVCRITSPGLGDGKYTYSITSANSHTVGTGNTTSVVTFTLDATPPPVPLNRSPKAGANSFKHLVKLSSKASKGAVLYDFRLTRLADLFMATGSYKRPALGFELGTNFGAYSWDLQATDAAGNHSGYSSATNFVYTLMKSPKNGLPQRSGNVKFVWKAYMRGATYELVYSQNPAFDPDARVAGDVYIGPQTMTNYKTNLAPLTSGTWYWTVRVNGGGSWMPVWSFSVP